MNRTIEDIQKDIELLGIKGGYDIEQLLTPQDCRRLSYEIERLNNIIKNIENICESSIASVDNILQDEKETKIVNGICINRNEYQIVRLKAYRTKSKEILGRIKELKGSDKE